VINFQGVRTYDPNAAQWTTPDAYAGDVHDPMTQKPFMWNRNNPFEYSDPSGYFPREVVEILIKFALKQGAKLGAQAVRAAVARVAPLFESLPTAVQGFRAASLAEHFERHGAEFGASTAKDCEGIAKALYSRTSGVEARMAKDGDIGMYDRSTNTFASYDKNGVIKTLFKLREGADFWDKPSSGTRGSQSPRV
jgi:hypothetical protein